MAERVDGNVMFPYTKDRKRAGKTENKFCYGAHRV